MIKVEKKVFIKENGMQKVQIDFSKNAGKIKELNGVNNGPTDLKKDVRNMGNSQYFLEAGIKNIRLHDTIFYESYGHDVVDVRQIFKNEDADETDPKSYDFEMTDALLSAYNDYGMDILYRIGSSIEHKKKFGTIPPKSNEKYARVCEMIIRHYTEGWADGFHFPITKWELWNEPELFDVNMQQNPCWQGTHEEFFRFYSVLFTHLKKTFPKLKFGTPAFVTMWWPEYVQNIVDSVKPLKPDFVSFHWYGDNMKKFNEHAEQAKKVLDGCGLTGTPNYLDEWNYIHGWTDEPYVQSIKVMKSVKGAAFVASVMAQTQRSVITGLYYYDARPCSFCGLFDSDTLEPLKTYHTFRFFNEVKKLKTCAYSTETEEIHTLASYDKAKDKSAVMVSFFPEDLDNPTPAQTVCVEGLQKGKKYELFMLDETRDGELIATKKSNGSLTFKMQPYSVALIKSVNE